MRRWCKKIFRRSRACASEAKSLAQLSRCYSARSVFALIALCVSGVGIHGTVAHVVSRRTTEIGVRMALGAQRGDVLTLVLVESGLAVAGGVALGVVGALQTSRLLAHFLYEVTTRAVVAFSGVVIVVVVTASLAVLIPAARAGSDRSRPGMRAS